MAMGTKNGDIGEHLRRLITLMQLGENGTIDRGHTIALCTIVNQQFGQDGTVLRDMISGREGVLDYYRNQLKLITMLARDFTAVLNYDVGDQSKFYTMLFWLLSHVAALSAHDRCQPLRSDIQACLRDLMRAFPSNLFGAAVEALANCLFKLSLTNLALFETDACEMVTLFAPEVKKFAVVYAENDLRIYELIFQAMSILVHDLIPWMTNLSNDVCSLLWATLLKQMELGEVDLKTVTLRCVSSLLCHGVCVPEASLHLVDHLLALADVLTLEAEKNLLGTANTAYDVLQDEYGVAVSSFCSNKATETCQPALWARWVTRLRSTIGKRGFSACRDAFRHALTELLLLAVQQLGGGQHSMVLADAAASAMEFLVEQVEDKLVVRLVLTAVELDLSCSLAAVQPTLGIVFVRLLTWLDANVLTGRDETLNIALRKLQFVIDLVHSVLQAFNDSAPVGTVIPSHVLPFLNTLTRLEPTKGCLLELLINSNSRRLSLSLNLLASLSRFADFPLPDVVNTCAPLSLLLSLPWLQDDVNWRDLRCAPDLIRRMHGYSQCFCRSVASEGLLGAAVDACLRGLVGLPKAMVLEWRKVVFKFALRSPDVDVIVTALHHLPCFLAKMPTTCPVLFDELIGTELLYSSTTVVSLACTDILGECACIMAGCGSYKWQRCEGHPAGVWSLYCEVCDAEQAPVLPNTYAKMFSQIDKSVDHQNSCKRFLTVLPRILRHVASTAQTDTFLIDSFACLDSSNLEIRSEYRQCIPIIIQRGPGAQLRNTLCGKLFAAPDSYLLVEPTLLWLDYVYHTAIFAQDELFERCLIALVLIAVVDEVRQSGAELQAIAAQRVHDLQSTRRLSSSAQSLFQDHAAPLLRALVPFLCNIVRFSEGKVGVLEAICAVFTDLAELFDYCTPEGALRLKDFVRDAVPHLLPPLIKQHTDAASKVHQCLAKLLDTNRYSLLAQNIKFIAKDVLFEPRDDEMMKMAAFIQNEGSLEQDRVWSIEDYIGWDICGCLYEVLRVFSVDKPSVIRALERFRLLEPIETKSVVDYLQKRLYAMLLKFEYTFRAEPPKARLIAMRSLRVYMEEVGPRSFSTVYKKALVTLGVAMRVNDVMFRKECCRAYGTLLRCVEDEKLKNVVLDVVVALLPLGPEFVSDVEPIFKYSFVDKRAMLEPDMKDFCFALTLPEYRQLHIHVPKFAEHEQLNLADQLKIPLRVLTHDSLDVKMLALRKIKAMLEVRQVELYRLISGSDSVEPIVVQLINALMSVITFADPDIRLLVAECFGIIGAIDPGRLNFDMDLPSNRGQNTEKSQQTDISTYEHAPISVDFPVALIKELIKCYVMAVESNRFNVCSLAIQDVLKFYRVKEQKDIPSMYGGKLWLALDDNFRQIVTPLLSTAYVARKPTRDLREIKKPIYEWSIVEKGYQGWLITWYQTLLESLRITASVVSTGLEHEKKLRARDFFAVTEMALEMNDQLALFLLPHLVLYLLLNDSPRGAISEQIKLEIVCVMTDAGRVADWDMCRHDAVSQDYRHAAQAVFGLLDFLRLWEASARRKPSDQPQSTSDAERLKSWPVKAFLETIPEDVMAKAACRCQDHVRALMCYEAYLARTPNVDMQQHLHFIQELYASLDEPDAVQGVLTVRRQKKEPSVGEQILAYESAGNYTEALPFHEQAIQQNAFDVTTHLGLIKCLMHLNQPSIVQKYIDGLIAQQNVAHLDRLHSHRVEAAWKLQSWDSLETYIEKVSPVAHKSFNVCLGEVILDAKRNRTADFLQHIRSARADLGHSLARTTLHGDAYARGYKFVTRLHMLYEVEQSARSLLGIGGVIDKDLGEVVATQDERNHLNDIWAKRLSAVQSSASTLEPMLETRRQLMYMRGCDVMKVSIGQSWLQSATVARKAGHLQSARAFLVRAKEFEIPDVFVEEAKLYYCRSQIDEALITLQNGMREWFPDFQSMNVTQLARQTMDKRVSFAKAQLLLANYTMEASAEDSMRIYQLYQQAINAHKEWDLGHYYLACFFEKFAQQKTGEPQSHIVALSVNSFGNALRYGSAFLHHAMPRLLTLWLDLGAKGSSPQQQPVLMSFAKGTAQKSVRSPNNCNYESLASQVPGNTPEVNIAAVNQCMVDLITDLPPYQFYWSFSQLISRICHPNPQVFELLKEVIAKVIVSYPKQSLWLSLSVSRSVHKARQERCALIFDRAKQIEAAECKRTRVAASLPQLIADMHELASLIVALAQRSCDAPRMSLNQPSFRKLLNFGVDKRKSQILLPMQTFMNVTLPATVEGQLPDPAHQPFPKEPVHIHCFEDEVEILTSLVRPKKVTLRGTDGRRYNMLVKPKDDLRLDRRYIEFCELFNACLRRDTEARRRQLYIRTYTVVPLSEECGLIEWVSNLHGLRAVIMDIYRERGVGMTGMELKRLNQGTSNRVDSDAKLLSVFENQLLPRHPAVLGDWFRRHFLDPTAWYLARTAFTRTAAVMSMVGYVLGLGDRHGENISLDSRTGDVFHVDFNCVFNKGEDLDVPELVPFRLTQNMVNAMGPLGVEGMFRKSCEVTLRVLRLQREVVITALQTFLHDPLVEWTKKRSPSDASTSTLDINEKAKRILSDLDLRLKGAVKPEPGKQYTLPLSVEGQVNYLIAQAMDKRLLAKMYLGWAAYM